MKSHLRFWARPGLEDELCQEVEHLFAPSEIVEEEPDKDTEISVSRLLLTDISVFLAF